MNNRKQKFLELIFLHSLIELLDRDSFSVIENIVQLSIDHLSSTHLLRGDKKTLNMLISVPWLSFSFILTGPKLVILGACKAMQLQDNSAWTIAYCVFVQFWLNWGSGQVKFAHGKALQQYPSRNSCNSISARPCTCSVCHTGSCWCSCLEWCCGLWTISPSL